MIPKVAIDIIYELWPMLTLVSVVLITLRLVYLKESKKPFILYKELMGLCCIIYIILLFELVTSSDFNSYSNNFIPFKEIFRYELSSKLFYRNVLGNIIIFLPFSYFTSYFCKINKFYFNLLVVFVTSLAIELIQIGIGRSFDVDDIILNIIGGFVGYLVYIISRKILKKHSINIKNTVLLNIIGVLLILIICYIILVMYGVML